MQAVRRGASEDIDLNELRVDEGLEGVPDLALLLDRLRASACLRVALRQPAGADVHAVRPPAEPALR